jgi:Second Messenger Oligonucleotide or Dinucleotide Synthetase domain
MNVAYPGPWPKLEEHDALLMDVARRVQLTKTMHDAAETNFRALCKYVDRLGSPLENRVVECYPSGSFATGTAIASRVVKAQHDVDVVLELDIPADTPPQLVLDTLFDAINGDIGSRYHGKVKKNSRCVTVEYGDGTTVDLMPIARILGPDRAGHLFHHKGAESLHKPVNPWGFAKHFKDHIEYDSVFRDLFVGRRILVEGQLLEKAETQPMPEHVPIEEKSPRVVALQLIKRARDVAFRPKAREHLRKPPSVVLAAIALEAGPVHTSLLNEVIAVANTIRARLMQTWGPRGTVQVLNPAYEPDVFTDRWPENKACADLFDEDLRRLVVALHKLKSETMSLADKRELLKGLFGETAATYAIESTLTAREHERQAGRMHIGTTGRVLGGAATTGIIGALRSTAARAGTREGGRTLSE